MFTTLTLLTQLISSVGMRVLACLLVLFVSLRLIRIVTRKIGSMKYLDGIDTNLKGFIQSSVRAALYTVLAISCCGILGVDTASLITVLASAGVAIGLAMQGALSNVAGGFLILFLHPFHVGDYIEAGGVSGTVKSINMFSTQLETVDNKVIIVPNGTLTASTITNYSMNGKRRVDLDFTVGYAMDTTLVRETIINVAKTHSLVSKEDEIFVRITRQEAGAYVYSLRVWCSTADYWNVNFDMQELVKEAFEKNHIVVPHAAMDVHMV